MCLALAVGVCRRIPPLIQVIVDLIDPAGAGLADLAPVRLKFGDSGRVCVLRGKSWS